MSREYVIEVTETITRRVVLRATSQQRARELVEAGPLSYLKAVSSDDITSTKREIISVSPANKEQTT